MTKYKSNCCQPLANAHWLVREAHARRVKLKMTVRTMCQRAGIAYGVWYRWLRGRPPDLMLIEAVLTVVGLKLKVILDAR